MSPLFLQLLIFGLLAALANVLGGLVLFPSKLHQSYKRFLKYLLALGAGFMLAVTIFEILPESVVLWQRSKSVEGRGEGPTFVGRTRSRMISALTQSGGGWLPEIHPSARLERAIAAAPAANRVLLDAHGEQSMLSIGRDFPMVIALGPEGGLEEVERRQLIDAGFTPVRLAPSILRFETAGIAALAVARAMAENSESISERT